jgi:hypothetical protein
MEIQSYDQLLKSNNIGITGEDRVQELRKALTTTNSGAGGIQSGPLMLENLDAVMTEVLVTERHFKMFNLLPKVPSAQPYYEWNRHTGFGSSRGSIGFRQGGGPKGGTSSFTRSGIYTKWLGARGGITDQMLIAAANGGSFEDPKTRENRDRTMELLERVDRELIFGNKLLLDDGGEEVNFDGLLTYLAANGGSVIDKAGAAFGFSDLDNDALALVTTGKQPTVDGYTCLMSPHVMAGLNAQYQDRNIIRADKTAKASLNMTPGFKVPAYETQFGSFEFDHSILLEEVPGGTPLTAAPANVPASPAITTQPAAATLATVHIPAATYYYGVSAFNDTGESVPVTTSSVAVVDGQKVTIVVTRLAGATGYRIYRGKASDLSDAQWIARVPQTASGNLTFIDDGSWRPLDANGKAGNGLVIEVKPNPADICIAQMAPLVRKELPAVDTTYPFLLLLYIVLVPKALERIRIYKNCGTYVPA